MPISRLVRRVGGITEGYSVMGLYVCTGPRAFQQLQCGCPVEANENSCEMCPDSLDDPTLIYESFDIMCGDLVTTSLFYESDSDMCDLMKMIGALECGCPVEANEIHVSCAPTALKTRRSFMIPSI